MSRTQRRKGLWPMSQYAKFLWHTYGLWEDILALCEVYKHTADSDTKIIIARHFLVDFDSLDELLKEFHNHIKNNELNKLSERDVQRVKDAFIKYHRAVGPHRKKLKQIRNNFGAHRTVTPWENARKAGVTDVNEWGKWEQFLVGLESYCDLAQWIGIFNEAQALINVLKDFNLDGWYSWSDKNKIKVYVPIQL